MPKWKNGERIKIIIPGITFSDALPEEEGDDMLRCNKSVIVTDTSNILAVVIQKYVL